jgi:hypothetical protein
MMPAVSEKQKKFMDAVAHNPAFAKKVGVPKAVGKDFSEASKGMKFGKGSKSRADVQSINKPKTNQGATELFKKGGETMATKMNPGMMAMMTKKKAGAKKMADGGMAPSKMGAVKTAAPSKDGVASKGKTKGTQIVMAGNKGMKNGGKC